MIEQLLKTPLTELVGVRHPVVQTGMGWVAGPRLVSATANAGGLGILASATMTLAELEQAILEVKSRTDNPFGVNLRADAADAPDRCQLLIEHNVRVASFALAPKPELIAKLKEHDIVVMPSIGAAKHDHVVHGDRIDAGSADQCRQHDRAQVGRVHGREGAPALADRRADGVNDVGGSSHAAIPSRRIERY